MMLTGDRSVTTMKLRVLVVDDYPDSAESASMLLAFYGHECRTAVTGQGALEQAAAFDPDIVILDIGLPDISGYEIARILRARAGERPLYLAAVTGWGQAQDRLRAFAAGFDQHVIKPTDSEKIQQILRLASERTASRTTERAAAGLALPRATAESAVRKRRAPTSDDSGS